MISKRSALAMILFVLLAACSSGPQPAGDGEKITTNQATRPERQQEIAPKQAPATLSEKQFVSVQTEALLSEPPPPAPMAAAAPQYFDRKSRSDLAAKSKARMKEAPIGVVADLPSIPIASSQESYNPESESGFTLAQTTPLSTFSIDVDTASYANVRRFLNDGMMPPAGAVRAEEMINYFHYDYPEPTQGEIAIHSELGQSPWRDDASILKIGLKAKELTSAPPPSNLVFLVDVSGSMQDENKLPLLRQALHMLTDELATNDRIAIVTYAGNDRVALPPTSGSQKATIHQAIDGLEAMGSTNASGGIVTAYHLAEQNKIADGNNRVILASDGDFNVGVTSRGELEKLISQKRQSGIYLSVLGFGIGNYHDDNMELLADKGNGNYNYIDSLLEAKKVLVKQRIANLFTLANDVKIQVEFNPARVGAYRLIGYDNRRLASEDFNDDKKDAGEIGVGHTVTALYEILPPGAAGLPKIDKLKYQKQITTGAQANAQANAQENAQANGEELATIKLRYKPKGATDSVLVEQPVTGQPLALDKTSDDFRFASAVAGFAMLLNDSQYKGKLDYPLVNKLAAASRGKDTDGYRSEFQRLVETAATLTKYPKGKQTGTELMETAPPAVPRVVPLAVPQVK